jgi:hypothetical protein
VIGVVFFRVTLSVDYAVKKGRFWIIQTGFECKIKLP